MRRSNAMLAATMPNVRCVLAPGMGHRWLAQAASLHSQTVRAWLKDASLPDTLRSY